MGFKRKVAESVADALYLALRAAGKGAYRVVLDSLWERQPFYEMAGPQEPLEIALYYQGYVDPNPGERELVERIFSAFKRAKADQAQADPVFLPASGWQSVLDTAFAPLAQSLIDDDIGRFHHFLANFRSWKVSTGMEPSQQMAEYARDPRRRRHFEQRIVAPLLRWWMRSESHGRGLSALAMPRYGNQCGVMVDGHLVAPSSIFCDVYGRLIAGFAPRAQPVLAELGAGFGRLFYFTARHLEDARFVDFDLPESLCCAAYFLLQAYPDRRFLLYGEGDLTAASLEEHDVILFPSFAISKLPDRSVDLFINENSLGVMSPAACRLFVREICRSANAFFHRNAESSRLRFPDGTTSLVNREYPVPMAEFDEVVRYRDVGRMMSSGRLNFDNDMYWYYYRRKGSSAENARRGPGPRTGSAPQGGGGRTGHDVEAG